MTLIMFKVTGSRLMVGSGSDHDVAQLDHVRNICAKFELFSVVPCPFAEELSC